MKTLLKLRDEEIQNRVNHCDGTEYNPKMFIAMDFRKGAVIYNGWFIDPCMNLIEVKDFPGKCVHLSDVELSEIQGDFVDNSEE